MTYLTQVTLDFATAAKLRFHDNYDWHQAVWKAFPGRDGENRDFLTRLDQQRDGFRLLIVSPEEPIRPNWCPSDAESWKIKRIPESYFKRNRYAFQLRANPTRKITKERPDGTVTKNGRRVPMRTREELVNGLSGKESKGLSLSTRPRCGRSHAAVNILKRREFEAFTAPLSTRVF